MRYLLDTNVLVWYLTGNSNLDPHIYEIIAYRRNIYTSIVSLQEIAIKIRNGGLILKMSFEELCKIISAETSIKIVQIEISHLEALIKLTPATKQNDPFDHLIISQAMAEKMCVLSSDRQFAKYSQQGLSLIEN